MMTLGEAEAAEEAVVVALAVAVAEVVADMEVVVVAAEDPTAEAVEEEDMAEEVKILLTMYQTSTYPASQVTWTSQISPSQMMFGMDLTNNRMTL